MASIRRTLSPVPRPGPLMNGDTCQVSSPLSRSSSNSQNYPSQGNLLPSSLGSLDYALYKAQNLVLGFFSQRSSGPLDRSRVKGYVWRRAIFHFITCFVVGVFIGVTTFISPNLSSTVVSKHQAFYFEVFQPAANNQLYFGYQNETSVVDRLSVNENITVQRNRTNGELKDGIRKEDVSSNFLGPGSDLAFRKLLIIVTRTHARPLQNYYLNRMAQTLKLVPHPLLWIVVEMNSQSAETANLLRGMGLIYRHLVCRKNSTDMKDINVHLRNVALSHIETHHLDGIVYFADDDNIYSADLFNQMRQIRGLGTWLVARLVDAKSNVILEGPICNGSQVVGWHIEGATKVFRRFHADMSGFAFNSTIIWDPRRWHRPTLESIRQLDTVKEGVQASEFIEHVVEDESQMECLSLDSRIVAWSHEMELLKSFPHKWSTANMSTVVPLA